MSQPIRPRREQKRSSAASRSVVSMLSPANRMTAAAPIHTLAQRQTSAFAATACRCSDTGKLNMRALPFSPTIGSVPPMANEMKDA